MTEDFASSNPFRRKTPTAVADPPFSLTPSQAPIPPSALSFTGSSPSILEPEKLRTKAPKKVRVQSPPPSSPEETSIPQKPPTPIPRSNDPLPPADDPFDNDTDSSDLSDDDSNTVTSNYVPANPFQKTLATMEHTEGAQGSVSTDDAGVSKAGKPSMDVDAFKRLLMTGSTGGTNEYSGAFVNNAPTVPSAANSQPPTNATPHSVNDGTSTDTSSVSKQSLFEPIQENHPESPRTSHEVSDPDDERRPYSADGQSKSSRPKPPPPSHKHGKLIKIELRDENQTSGLESPALLGAKKSEQSLYSRSSVQSNPSLTDLNKPLPPPPPPRASHEADRESIFDVESAGKTPEPPSPGASVKRKTPPAPPLSRRHSQLVSDSKLIATQSGRLSPNFEEPLSFEDDASSNMFKGPPPPPSRRPASIRSSYSYDLAITSPPIISPGSDISVKSPPPVPPPTRMASKRVSGRPPSVHSMDISGKRLSAVHPPPPPPRQRASSRTSMEAPALSSPAPSRASGEYLRKSMEEKRRGSHASQPDSSGYGETENTPPVGPNNILADLAALQREVDALRGVTEKGN